ncbi:MAG: hypothetical protein U0236_03080 [Nitrospira sp.]
MKNKVVMFEIPSSHFQNAKQFYEQVFDWKVGLWGDEGAMALTTAADKDCPRPRWEESTVASTNANLKMIIRCLTWKLTSSIGRLRQ